ncbi:MAG: hypothetical protein ACTSRH_02445 [Promethearchaeota archaeon]
MKSYQIKYIFYDNEGNELNLDWTGDINYPFLSPFKVLFTEGRPVGKIAYLILKFKGKFYAFGTIVYSKGGRYIFFSAIKNCCIYDSLSEKRGELLHITLNANKDKFHIKFKNTKTIVPIFKTDEIEKDHYYWFSLALKHPSVLFPLKHIKYNFETPKRDGTRRLNEIFFSREDIINKILTIPENKLYDDEFLDFDFYISKQGIDETNAKLIPPTNIPPRSKLAKLYNVDLIDTDFKLGIIISRMRKREVLGSDLARLYHHEKVKELLNKKIK